MRHEDIPAHLNDLTDRVIGAAIEVHKHLGPGLLERLYEQALAHEFGLRDIGFEAQREIVVPYKGVDLGGQRADIIVERTLVVELKAVEAVADVHLAQLVSYMRAGGYPIGLLLNFNVPVMHKGIYRRINPASLSAISASPRSTTSAGGSR